MKILDVIGNFNYILFVRCMTQGVCLFILYKTLEGVCIMSKKVILKQSKVCLALAAVLALTGSTVWATDPVLKGKGPGLSVGEKANAKFENSIAVGDGAQASGQAIAIGNNSLTRAFDTVAVGHESKSYSMGDVAIGNYSQAVKIGATALGYHSFARSENSIAIGFKANTNDLDATHAIALGTQASSTGVQALAVGAEATATNTDSISIGTKSSNAGKQSISFGRNSGIAETSRDSIAIGSMAYVGAINKDNPTSTVPEAPPQDKDYTVDYTIDEKYHIVGVDDTKAPNLEDATKNSIAMGFKAKAFGFQTISIGAASETHDSNSIALGVSSIAKGHYSVAIGQQSRTAFDNAVAIGHYAETHGQESTALGYYSRVSGTNNTAIGDYTRLEGVSNSVAIGSHARSLLNNSIVLGKDSLVAPSESYVKAAYLSEEVFSKEQGVVSVGNVDYKVNIDDESISVPANTRRIINVAGGYDATDAVNVAQLKALEQKIENNMGPQDVTFIADSNLSVSNKPINDGKAKQVTLGLNKDINLGVDGSVKAGNTTINKNGIITNGGVQITDKGINAGDKVISHVGPGEQPTDAVNVSQLKDLKTNINNDLTTGLQNARNEIGRVESKLNKKIEKTGAMGAALAALNGTYDLDYKKTAINAGLGYYKGESAIALGVAHRVNEDVRVSAGLAYSGNSDTMVNAGISWAVGSAPNASVNIREENKELRNRLADQEARLQAQQAEINELKAAMQAVLQK